MHCTKRSSEFKGVSIQHHHFPSLPSTQTFLKENWQQLRTAADGQFILVSTDEQSEGIGRQGAPWKHLNHSLAISFAVPGHQHILSLTSLEMACLVTKFFEHSALQLKWPNDLLIENKKCGGLILQNLSDEFFACGLGLNINQPDALLEGLVEGPAEGPDHNSQAGSLKLEAQSSLQNLPYELYSFILNNRLSSEEIQKTFRQRCLHLNRICEIKQGQEILAQGRFVGIGRQGEALIKNANGQTHGHFSGSLSWSSG